MLERVKDLLTPYELRAGHVDPNTGLDALEGLGGGGWEETPRGRNGYTRGLMRGHVSLWFGGSAEMGVSLHVTGQGCRQLEAEGVIDNDPESPFNWRGFLDSCRSAGGRFSRLDVALDDFAGLLDLSVVHNHLVNRFYVSRVEHRNYHESFVKVEGCESGIVGRSCYFGGPKSPSVLRMYDKRVERLSAGECANELPEHWVRAELQVRDDRADNLAGWLIRQGVAGVAAVLRAFISFRTPSETDSDRRRWPVAEWWETFLGHCEKAPGLATKPEVKALAHSLDWFRRQYSAVLAVAVRASGFGLNWVADMIAEGEVSLRRSAHRYRSRLQAHETAIHRVGAGQPISADVSRPDRWRYDTGDSRAVWGRILKTRSQVASLRRLSLPDLLESLPARIVADGVAEYAREHGLSLS